MDKDNIDETSDEIIDETKDIKDSSNGSGPKMKYCPNCGKLKPEASRFCPECGRDRYGRSAGEPQFTPPPPRAPMAPQPAGYPYQRNVAIPQKKPIAPALAALIVSLVNFFFFGSLLTFISLPVIIVLSVIVLKRGYAGKPMIIISIVITVISAVLFAFYIAIIAKVAPDFKYFADNDREIVENYERYGEIPERYEKYRDEKYDTIWSRMGYDDFDDFFSDIVKWYRKNVLDADKDSDSDSRDKNESRTTTTRPAATEPATDFDHSGEELVVLS